MQVTETNSEGLSREYQITITREDLDERLMNHLESIKGQVRMNGFRPGKVPVPFLKKTYGKSMMGEIIQEAMNEGTQKAINDNDLRPAIQPKVDMDGEIEPVVEGKEDLSFKIAVEVMPDFEITDLAKLELDRPVAEVADEDLDEMLNRLAEQNRSYSERDEKDKAEDGDALQIDFVGRVDGEEFDGGKGDDIRLTIGANQFIPGFEEQLIGTKKGDEKTIKVTFPDDYGAEHLKGKDAEFDVTVNSVSAPDELSVDDALAEKLGLESLDKLKETLSNQISEDYKSVSRARLKRNMLDKLDELHSFELPPGMVETEFEQIWNQVQQQPEEEKEDKSEEELKTEYREIAERRVRLGLLLAEVGRVNNISVSQEELNRSIAERARQYPGQETQIFQFYQQNPGAMAEIRAPLFEDKVVDFVSELATINDVTVSREELMKDPDEEAEEETKAAPKKKKAAPKKKAASKAKEEAEDTE